jgi:hypothetical protein
MNQILHIFRKDIRHHWIVILLCQAALVAYCWMVVTGWNDQENFGFNAVSGIIRLLPAMIWCLLFLRVVQDESLVGDRQFWVTRPYEWKKLLAEKILFVLVFLNLPLLIAGTVLLIKAGFSPAPHFLGLLWMQVLLFHLPFLPLLALATVTRNLVQGLVTLFAGLLASTAISILPLYFSLGSTRFAAVAVSVPVDVHYHSGDLRDLLLLVVCIAAIGLQYAFRKTAQSRLWLVGGVLAMVAIDLISGYATRNRDPFPVPARETVEFHAAVNTAKLAPPKRRV